MRSPTAPPTPAAAPPLAPVRPWRNVRLDTLVRLRWVSIIGQCTAVLVVRAAGGSMLRLALLVALFLATHLPGASLLYLLPHEAAASRTGLQLHPPQGTWGRFLRREWLGYLLELRASVAVAGLSTSRPSTTVEDIDADAFTVVPKVVCALPSGRSDPQFSCPGWEVTDFTP